MAFFEINLKKVKQNYLELKKALPKTIISYAIKANYDPKILKTLAQEGCAAEVCSDYEHGVAQRNGFKKIIRNGYGPYKKAWLTNLELVEDRSKVKGLVGARLNLNDKSKLGIKEDEILKHKWDCISIHTRKGFEQALSKTEKIAKKVGAKYIDVGGGLNEERIKLLKNKNNIIIEPGRYMVANTCRVISKVLAVKDDKVILDVGMNFLNKFSDNKYTVTAPGKKDHTYKVYGPIPTDIDSIGTHNLPELKKGDQVVIENAGAYTQSMASKWTNKVPKIKYF